MRLRAGLACVRMAATVGLLSLSGLPGAPVAGLAATGDHDVLPKAPGGAVPGFPGAGARAERVVKASGTVAKGVWKNYGPYTVASGKTLTATLSGAGDADLYVRRGAAPTSASYDCRSYTSTSSGRCTVAGPGKIYVGVQGYAATSTFSLEVRYTE